MIVRFGLALDGKIPEPFETRIGHVSAGPQGFLSILETQLGLTVPDISPAVRMVQYHECLRKMDSPARFYHRSFEVDALAVLAYLDGKIAKWWMPNDVVFVDEIPHTATGKIQKMDLRKQFEDFQFSN